MSADALYTVAIPKLVELDNLWLIVLFPFLGAVINGLLGRQLQAKFGKSIIHYIAIGMMLCSFAVAIIAFAQILTADDIAIVSQAFPMIDIGWLSVNFALYFDPLSVVLALIITGIGTLIHVYSTGYMKDDPAYWRFFCYLNLFIFSMLLLVLGDSFVLMFFGWEGVGLCSYLLIGFWYKDMKKATAGFKAFVVNRIGDFAFITGLFFLFWGLGGHWNQNNNYDVHSNRSYEAIPVASDATSVDRLTSQDNKELVSQMPSVVFRDIEKQMTLSVRSAETGAIQKPFADALTEQTVGGIPLVFLICFLFFLGACGKSAQIPLYVWLPDAMAGPTPVSALIHAATMVTAGIYMIVRLNFLFVLSPGVMTVIALVGACTALFAATIGMVQHDLKKVLAYSTISQLGFMFLGVGVGAWWAAVFHLLTHACFKACLFLGAGSVIHSMGFLKSHDKSDDTEDNSIQTEPTHASVEEKPSPTDPQDMRNMGGLGVIMSHTRRTYLIACLAIAGFPVAAGFYSKDEILWKAMSNGQTFIPGWILWSIGFVAAGCTSFYMFRSYYMVFYGAPPSEECQKHAHESPRSMTHVLWVLAGASIVTAVLGLPHLITGVDAIFAQWLAPMTAPFVSTTGVTSAAWLEGFLIVASIGIAIIGWLIAKHFYHSTHASMEKRQKWYQRFRLVHHTLYNKYWIDELYQMTWVRGFKLMSHGVATADKFVVGLVINGGSKKLGQAFHKFAQVLRLHQTGYVNNYAYGIAIGTVVLVLVAQAWF